MPNAKILVGLAVDFHLTVPSDAAGGRGGWRKVGAMTAGTLLRTHSMRVSFGLGIAAALLAGTGSFLRADSAAPPPKCAITSNGYMDPNYTSNMPVRSRVGSGFELSGVIRSGIDCSVIPRARVEIWHAGPSGAYDATHRGAVITDAGGHYRFDTDFPGSSFGQPHIHVRVAVPGFKTVATVFLPKPGTKNGTLDIVLEPEV
jgi:hypothetical protein